MARKTQKTDEAAIAEKPATARRKPAKKAEEAQEPTSRVKTPRTAGPPTKNRALFGAPEAPQAGPVEKSGAGAARKKTLFEEVQEERENMAKAAKTRRSPSRPKPEVPQEADTPEKQERPSRTRSTRPSAGQPQPPAERSVPEAKPQRRRTTPPSQKEEDTVSFGDPSFPVPQWRSAGPQPETSARGGSSEGESPASPDLAPRRSRSRKARQHKEREARFEERNGRDHSVSESRVPVEAAAPVPQAVPVHRREPVFVPEDAAQVLMRDGVPVIVSGRKVLPPLIFFASAEDEARLATVLDEAKLASECGVHLFSFLIELVVDESAVDEAVALSGYFLKRMSAIDPESKVMFRTVFVAPAGCDRSYPKGSYTGEDGQLADPSICDDEFWSAAEGCLQQYLRKLRKLDRDDRVLGAHLERGEWFQSEAAGYDTSVSATEKFREWLRHRYRDDVVSLRAAWFDGNVDFQTVNVPEYQEMRRSELGFVRTDRKARRWVDYHLFLSDVTCERLADLAYAARVASEGRYLVGVSYGYTFEWSHPSNGHLSLGKLLRCPDIDYIGGPPSYKGREPGSTAAFPAPIDSFALNGKLYISEEDFKTPISGQKEPDDFNPVMKTPQALGSVHWRGAGSALAHSAGAAWMDTWGNGWLASRGIWERAQSIQEALVWNMGAQPKDPDVAVFVDERSLAYLVDRRAFEALVQNVRESVLRSGLSAGFYLLSDLAHRENFPECKLHVFVNAWDIRPEVRSAIKTRLQRDGKVLFWLYSAGLFEGGRESLERVREVTGIALRPQPFNSRSGTTILNSREPLCQNLPEQALAKGGQLEPSYFAIPEDGVVLGEYSHTGLPSFVERTFASEFTGKWHSVFLGEPIVTPGLFRSLGQKCGAHVWSFQNDVVHARPPFLTVHCTETGPRTLALPDKWAAYNVIDREWVVTDGNSLRFQALDGSTHCFLVGTRANVEAILARDPDELLSIQGTVKREDNTLHWDMMRFDVPIMKLDEWVEESWSEELADDLLLKPSMLEVSEEGEDVPEEVQRSRGRRRRRRRSVNESGPESKPERGGDPKAMNVIFRKRD